MSESQPGDRSWIWVPVSSHDGTFNKTNEWRIASVGGNYQNEDEVLCNLSRVNDCINYHHTTEWGVVLAISFTPSIFHPHLHTNFDKLNTSQSTFTSINCKPPGWGWVICWDENIQNYTTHIHFTKRHICHPSFTKKK